MCKLFCTKNNKRLLYIVWFGHLFECNTVPPMYLETDTNTDTDTQWVFIVL